MVSLNPNSSHINWHQKRHPISSLSSPNLSSRFKMITSKSRGNQSRIIIGCIALATFVLGAFALPELKSGFENTNCNKTCTIDDDCKTCSKILGRSVVGKCVQKSCSYCIKFTTNTRKPNRCDKKIDGNKVILPCCSEPNGGEVDCLQNTLSNKYTFHCRPGFKGCQNGKKSCKKDEDCTCAYAGKNKNLIASCLSGTCSYCIKYGGTFSTTQCGAGFQGQVEKLPCCPERVTKGITVGCLLQSQSKKGSKVDSNDPRDWKCLPVCSEFDSRVKKCIDPQNYYVNYVGKAFTSCEESGNKYLWRQCPPATGNDFLCGASDVKCDAGIPCCVGYLCKNGLCKIDCAKVGEACDAQRVYCCELKDTRVTCVNTNKKGYKCKSGFVDQ